MSQENEVLMALVEPFNRRDFDDGLEHFHPEVELRPGVLAPDQDRRFVGHEGVKQFLREATEPWESVTVERKEIIDAPGDRFIALDRWLFRGRDGIEIERELPTVYSFRSGLVVRIDGFTDKAEALEAVGLRE